MPDSLSRVRSVSPVMRKCQTSSNGRIFCEVNCLFSSKYHRELRNSCPRLKENKEMQKLSRMENSGLNPRVGEGFYFFGFQGH